MERRAEAGKMPAMIIDFHVHIFPDELAARVMPVMAERAGVEVAYDGTASGLLRHMDKSGVDISVVQPVATRPGQHKSVNSFGRAIRGERIVPFGAVHPADEDVPAIIASLATDGFPGVKLHPEYQEFYPDEERLFPLYEACAAHGLMVLFHCGEDIGLTSLRGTPDRLAAVVERFPELTFVLAHSGGFQMWEDVKKHVVCRPAVLETSYTIPWLPAEAAVGIWRAHGIERVVFGSDGPWDSAARQLKLIRNSGLTEDELAPILSGNALALLGGALDITGQNG